MGKAIPSREAQVAFYLRVAAQASAMHSYLVWRGSLRHIIARLFGTDASDGLITELLGYQKHLSRAGIGLGSEGFGTGVAWNIDVGVRAQHSLTLQFDARTNPQKRLALVNICQASLGMPPG